MKVSSVNYQNRNQNSTKSTNLKSSPIAFGMYSSEVEKYINQGLAAINHPNYLKGKEAYVRNSLFKISFYKGKLIVQDPNIPHKGLTFSIGKDYNCDVSVDVENMYNKITSYKGKADLISRIDELNTLINGLEARLLNENGLESGSLQRNLRIYREELDKCKEELATTCNDKYFFNVDNVNPEDLS